MKEIKTILFKRLHPDALIPIYGSALAAGFDLNVCTFKQVYEQNVAHREPIPLEHLNNSFYFLTPQSRLLVGCGFSIALPEGYQLEVRSRSGLALKEGIIVLNAPGTIDEDYRGEVGIILINTSKYDVVIRKGERMAQAVLMRYDQAYFEDVEELPATVRGEGGYGSTLK